MPPGPAASFSISLSDLPQKEQHNILAIKSHQRQGRHDSQVPPDAACVKRMHSPFEALLGPFSGIVGRDLQSENGITASVSVDPSTRDLFLQTDIDRTILEMRGRVLWDPARPSPIVALRGMSHRRATTI